MSENTAERDYSKRQLDAERLLDDFELNRDAEFFADPNNRVEFLESLDADDFFSICQHVNARMRNMEPRDRKNTHDKGAFLPVIGTPDFEEKPAAFKVGYEAMKEYLRTTKDTPEEKVRGLGMAAEALIIWVHPFNDGNGRTSRFIASFIENGTTDTDLLIRETADKEERLRIYTGELRTDTYNLITGPGDLLWDEGEYEEFERSRNDGPSPTEGISQSITRLLEDKSYQDLVDANKQRFMIVREKRRSKTVNAA